MKRKRIAALLLALVLCLGLLPMTALAGEGGETVDQPGGDRMSFNLDPNGGTVDPNYYEAEGDWGALKIVGRLPTPTRPGYTFKGWYIDGVLVDESKPIASTAPIPRAQWERASKVTPALKVIPDKIEAGAETVEILLSCATGGAGLDWRPLERILYMDGKASDAEAAVKSYISGNFSSVGLKLTDVEYQHDIPVNDSAYPSALYPDGVYPTTGLTLTLEGTAKAGVLNINLAPEIFVQLVDEDEDTVLTEASADIFNAAQASISVGGGKAASKDGPFTVKFDLNYKNAKESEIPKEQKVPKGSAVSLPDGGKLTPPYSNYEFAGWCLKAGDGKLYPWNEKNAVTADMTLYANWVEKGTAKEDPKTEPPAQPAAPAKTAFTDVAATSPFAAAISWAVEQKITNGKTATTFGPGDPCTRAQIVTFLWRAAGSPEPKTLEAEYADVTKTDAYYYKAVQWAAETGMEESGTFAPDKTCTRGQAMYFIWKANDSGTSAGSVPSFTDLPKDSLYHDAVLWAVGKGVTNGTGDGTTFSPDNPCTRGQIVTFLYRAYSK
nr:S-layer homology domain-containing protein [uncultured Oscillibacter sp.]